MSLGLFPAIQGSAQFAQNGTLRCEIRRWWSDHAPTRWAAWLMLNPSVATADREDPTAKRVTHFSNVAGCDGWIGVNLYPFISSTPDEMWSWGLCPFITRQPRLIGQASEFLCRTRRPLQTHAFPE